MNFIVLVLSRRGKKRKISIRLTCTFNSTEYVNRESNDFTTHVIAVANVVIIIIIIITLKKSNLTSNPCRTVAV